MTPSLSACLGGGCAGGHSTPGALSSCALPSAGAPSVRDQGRAPLISGGYGLMGSLGGGQGSDPGAQQLSERLLCAWIRARRWRTVMSKTHPALRDLADPDLQ